MQQHRLLTSWFHKTGARTFHAVVVFCQALVHKDETGYVCLGIIGKY